MARGEHDEAGGEVWADVEQVREFAWPRLQFQPCVVPVLVATTLVDRPGSTLSKGGELMWLVSRANQPGCARQRIHQELDRSTTPRVIYCGWRLIEQGEKRD